jgi:opacity protein-like surface antigen
MRKTALAALGLIAALAAGPASAADILGSTKDGTPDTYSSPGVVNWTGFYIGGAVGYGNANHNLTVLEKHDSYCFDQFGNQLSGDPAVNSTVAPVDSFNPIGFGIEETSRGLPFAFNALGTCANSAGEGDATALGGIGADDSIALDAASRKVGELDGANSSGIVGDVRLGYDLAYRRFLVGVFGTYGFSGMETSASIAGLGSASIEKGDEWSLGVRAGVIVAPRTLAYILAAYTQTEYEFGIAGAGGSKDVTFDGVTVGGGIEFALAGNVFLGIEGTHTFYGEETVARFDTGSGLPGHRFELNDEIGETKIMGTLKIKLNDIGRGF